MKNKKTFKTLTIIATFVILFAVVLSTLVANATSANLANVEKASEPIQVTYTERKVGEEHFTNYIECEQGIKFFTASNGLIAREAEGGFVFVNSDYYENSDVEIICSENIAEVEFYGSNDKRIGYEIVNNHAITIPVYYSSHEIYCDHVILTIESEDGTIYEARFDRTGA